MTTEEKEILMQAIANYQQLWNEFLEEIDDGSWSRKAVEENIEKCKLILGIL